MVSDGRGILTLAYGADRYVKMAESLARSLIHHSPQIRRAVITDAPDHAELNRLFDVCVPLKPEHGGGLRQKVYLDTYTPFEQTLFLDSDSLVVGDIADIWRYFDGGPFGIPGVVKLKRGDKDPKLDVDYILDYFNLKHVSKFNSGLIYFDSSEAASSIFITARDLLSRYQELRLTAPDDEPIFAVSMAIHGVDPFLDDDRTMRTPMGVRGDVTIDVIKGAAAFRKYDELVRPAIVHFSGPFSASFEYRRECYRLQHHEGGIVQRIALAWLWMRALRSSTIQRRMQLRSRAVVLKQRLAGLIAS